MEEHLTALYRALDANIMFQVKKPIYVATWNHHTGAVELLYNIIINLCVYVKIKHR